MNFYHGTSTENLKIERHITSRYGFACMFFSNEIQLASLFAKSVSSKKKQNNGFIYELQFSLFSKVIDYKNGVTYSADFRNLIFKLFKEGYSSVLIKNAFDYPCDNFKDLIKSDILVIFDLDVIGELKLNEIVKL